MPLGQWSGHIWADLDLVPSRSPTPQAATGKKTMLDDLLVLFIRWLCWLFVGWFGWFWSFDFSFGFVFFSLGLTVRCADHKLQKMYDSSYEDSLSDMSHLFGNDCVGNAIWPPVFVNFNYCFLLIRSVRCPSWGLMELDAWSQRMTQVEPIFVGVPFLFGSLSASSTCFFSFSFKSCCCFCLISRPTMGVYDGIHPKSSYCEPPCRWELTWFHVKISLQIPWRASTPSTPPSRLVTGRGGCALDCLYDWHIFDTMIIIFLQYSYLMKSPKTNTTKVQHVSIDDLFIWYVVFVGF